MCKSRGKKEKVIKLVSSAQVHSIYKDEVKLLFFQEEKQGILSKKDLQWV